jgi:hypothetical protein
MLQIDDGGKWQATRCRRAARQPPVHARLAGQRQVGNAERLSQVSIETGDDPTEPIVFAGSASPRPARALAPRWESFRPRPR